MDFLKILTSGLSSYIADVKQAPLLVAYSGGMDSTVLLEAICRLRDAGTLAELRAVHVNHGLSGQANDWAKHCDNFCRQRNIPLRIESVSLPEKCQDGVELAARNVRYDIFERLIREGEYLLQAHHQRDQAETFLFRALRGSGIDGLSGIPVIRPLAQGYVFRPLLNTPWQKLKEQAEQWQLEWVEDDTNVDTRFDRNFLRQEVLPLLESRWPEAQKKLAEASGACEEAKRLLSDQTVEDFGNINVPAKGLFLENAVVLGCQRLSGLPESRQRRVLRYWFGLHNFKMPSRIVLERVLTEIIPSGKDAEPEVVWQGGGVRRFRGQLVAVSEQPGTNILPVVNDEWRVRDSPVFDLPGNGRLCAAFEKCIPDLRVAIRYRSQCEAQDKVGVEGRQGRKKLKKWLQEFDVPPWLRDRIPLLFIDGQLAVIPGIGFVSGEFNAQLQGLSQDSENSCWTDWVSWQPDLPAGWPASKK